MISIRKFSFGVVSVLIGTVFLVNVPLSHADVATNNLEDKVVTKLPSSVDGSSDSKEKNSRYQKFLSQIIQIMKYR